MAESGMDFVLDDEGGFSAPGIETDEPLLGTRLKCGAWGVVFPYGVGRSIAETFELVAVPKAPEWFSGAVNVEGEVLPVIDLGLFFTAGQGVNPVSKDAHLLVCSALGSDEDRIAILFEGLPQQVRYQASVLPQAGVPQRVLDVALRQAVATDGQALLEIDFQMLSAALAAELSVA